MLAVEQLAAARWTLGGGRAGEVKRRRAARLAAERRQLARTAAGFKRYFSQSIGPVSRDGVAARASVGLSGAVLEAGAGGGVHIEIERRVRRRRPSGRARQQQEGPLRDAGPTYDRWERWPVDRVYEVRRCQDEDARWIEARVRWLGVDRTTGLPYRDEWIRDRDEYGFVMNAALRSVAYRMEQLKYGCRVPKAAARQSGAPKRSRDRPEALTWQGRLRSGGGGGVPDEAMRPPRRRRMSRIVDG